MEDQASDAKQKDVYNDAKPSKFHFKPKKASQRQRSKDKDDASESRSRRRRRSYSDDEHLHRHRSSKRRRKHGTSRQDTAFERTGDYQDPDHRHRESLYDGLSENAANIDDEAIFRESLFDALADEEGADYWESVYGQPVHIYPNTKPGPGGELERMTDEEYAEFVRTKMWEKSHQHILEERAARERARQRKKEERRGLEEETSTEQKERERIMRQMEESLKRGEERKRAKAAEASWAKYSSKWEDLKNDATRPEAGQDIRQIIPWPVISGKAYDVEKEGIERFLRASRAWTDDAAALLKTERVRWHPDKMQQRFGQHMDADTMKLVTAVFQVVDRLWNERRK